MAVAIGDGDAGSGWWWRRNERPAQSAKRCGWLELQWLRALAVALARQKG